MHDSHYKFMKEEERKRRELERTQAMTLEDLQREQEMKKLQEKMKIANMKKLQDLVEEED